jgi:hypothetical protein
MTGATQMRKWRSGVCPSADRAGRHLVRDVRDTGFQESRRRPPLELASLARVSGYWPNPWFKAALTAQTLFKASALLSFSTSALFPQYVGERRRLQRNLYTV